MSIIRFRFTGDTSSLDKAAASAKKQLKQLKDEFRSGATEAAKWGAASAAAATAMGVAIFNAAAKSTSELKNFAAVANASVEEMQRMAHGAASVDVGLDKLSDMLKDVNERIGDFSRGESGPMADFFENIAPKLGITIEQFKTLSGPQALQAYYNALEQANVGQQQMTVYLEDMASDTTRLIPMLKNGGAGFAAMADEAERLGLVMSEIDANKLDAANDAVRKSTQIIDGVAKKFAVEMAPIVEGLASVFIGAAKESNGFADSVDSAFDAIVSGAGFGMDAVDGVRRAFVVAGQAAATFALAIQRDSISIAKAIWDMPIDAVNTLIELINSLPGVDLDVIAPGQFSEAMQREIDLAAGAVEAGKQAMNETLMAPLPSEAFKKFVEDAQAASQEAAEALAESGMIGPVGGSGENGEDGTEREKIKAKLEAIQEGYKSEIELAREKFGEEQEVLAEALEAKLLTEDEYRKASLDAENAYKDAQLKIQEDSEARKTAIQKAQSESRKRALGDALSQMTTLMNTESRKQFEIGKAAAIAQTVIETYSAAQKAFSSLAGIPIVGPALGAAAAAAAIAGGVARVNSIRSQSMGGSGTPSNTPTQQVNADSTPVGSAASSGGGQSVGNTTIALPLDGIVMDMAGLIRLLNEAQENGEGSINFVGV